MSFNNLSTETKYKRLKSETVHDTSSKSYNEKDKRYTDTVERSRESRNSSEHYRRDKRRSISPDYRSRSSHKVHKSAASVTHNNTPDTLNEIANSIIGNSPRQNISRYSTKNIAFACRVLGGLKNIQYIDNKLLRDILDQAISQNPNAQDIAMIINGLGKFAASAKNHLSYECMDALCTLVRLLPKKNPNKLDIANTVIGIGKLVENKFKLHRPESTMEAICSLIHLLPFSKCDEQNISNVVHGLGQIVEQNYKLHDEIKTMKALCECTHELLQLNPNSQAISNTVLGLSKFITADYTLHDHEKTLSVVFDMVVKLPKTSLTDQSISSTLHGLSKFIDSKTIVPAQVLQAVFELTQMVCPKTSDPRTVATIILAYSKFAENKVALHKPEETMAILCNLTNSLRTKNINAQETTMITLGLSRFIENGYQLYDEKTTMTTLVRLLESLQDKNPIAQNIGNTILGLSKFVERKHPLENPARTMAAVCTLIRMLASLKFEPKTVGQTVLGLSKFIDSGYSLDRSSETLKAITQLVYQMPQTTFEAQAVSNILHGLSRLVMGGIQLYNPDEILVHTVNSLITSTLNKKLISQEITMIVLAMGRLAEAGYLNPADSKIGNTVYDIAKMLSAELGTEQNMSNTLLGLSKFALKGFSFTKTSEFMYLVSKFTSAHSDKTPHPQNIAVTIFAISKLLECGLLLPNPQATMKALCSMFVSLQKANPDSLNIALAIQGMAKCVEHSMPLKPSEEALAAASTLIEIFPLLNPTQQQISMVVQSFGKLAEAGYQFSEETMAALTAIFLKIQQGEILYSTLPIAALGLSKFVTKGLLLNRPEKVMQHICQLVQSTKNELQLFSSQDISNLTLSISKLALTGIAIAQPEKTLPLLFLMMEKFSSEAPCAQNICLMAISLGNLATAGYEQYIPNKSVLDLCKLINIMPQLELIPRNISSTLFGLGTLVQEGFYRIIPEETIHAASRLALRLCEKPTEIKTIALTLLGITKLIEHKFFIDKSDEIMEIICSAIKNRYQDSIDPDDFSQLLTGISRAVKNNLKLSNAKEILAFISNNILALKAEYTKPIILSANVISISNLLRFGYDLDKPTETLTAICHFVRVLSQKNDEPSNTANALFGLGWIVNSGQALPIEIYSNIKHLFSSLCKKRLKAQQISMTLKALLFLFPRSNENAAFVHSTTMALLSSIDTCTFDNHVIFEILSILSEQGFDNFGDYANKLLSKLIWKRTHNKRLFTSKNVSASGLLGYAKLLNKMPNESNIKNLLSVVKLLESGSTSPKVLLSLLQAYAIFKEKNILPVVNGFNIELLQKRFLASDPSSEDVQLAGLEQMSTPSPLSPAQDMVIFTGFYQETKDQVFLSPMQKPTTYDLTTSQGQLALQAHLQKDKIKFIPESVPILVSPIFVIQNELGALAQRKLLPGEKLGNYLGDIIEGESGISGSMYAFDIGPNHEGVDRFMDARHTRNFAAFLNHSNVSNVGIQANNESITFEVSYGEILPNQQCFINYGEDFFPMLGFKPRYLDEADSWESFDQLVLQNRGSYLPTATLVSAEIQATFRLPTQKVLLNRLSYAILTENEVECLKLINSQADLWNYTVDDTGKIMAPDQQQRFTPLMLASYLGQTKVVKALLQKSKTNAQLLQTGETAAFLALKGKAANRSELFKLFFEMGIYINLTNRDHSSLLNVAVEENLPEVVELLLGPKCTLNKKEFLDLFANSQIDSLFIALSSGKLEAAKALLKKTSQSWLCPKIVDKEILVLKALDANPNFDKIIKALVESGNIHKNFAVVKAIYDRFGSKALWLIKQALAAKQWPTKQFKDLEDYEKKIELSQK